MRKELQRCLSTGALEPATCNRYVTKAFLVPKGEKWRLVVDFRHLNSHLRTLSCRFEALRRLSTLAKKGDWLFSLDLADGFHCLPVHPDDRRYLTFEIAGFGTFQCAAVPFGLNCSPYVFTKAMRTFVQALRALLVPTKAAPASRHHRPLDTPLPAPKPSPYRPPHLRPKTAQAPPRVISDLIPRFGQLMRTGLRVLPYMDDFLILCSTEKEALEAREYVSAILDLLGLSRNEKKGFRAPTQQLEHLGMGVNTLDGQFFVTPARLDKLQTAAACGPQKTRASCATPPATGGWCPSVDWRDSSGWPRACTWPCPPPASIYALSTTCC